MATSLWSARSKDAGVECPGLDNSFYRTAATGYATIMWYAAAAA